jgi:molybdopterin molybdotransferase
MLNNCEFITARDCLLDLVEPVGTEPVSVSSCVGRVLAAQVTAAADVPPFDRSPYDGYVFRAADTAAASKDSPVTLRILEEVAAGSVASQPVTAGTAVKILTGAPIPPGADAVCQFEKTEFTAQTVTLFSAFRAGDNIVRRGEDVAAGQVLAEAGTVIDGPLAGTLAAQGITAPTVYRRPVAGILTTGSELVEAGEALTPGKIVNSNRYTFEAELARHGLEPRYFGTPGDRLEDITAAMEAALAESDLVVVTGGVSVGDYDLTPAALEAIGAEIVVKNVDLKPGGKCCYGLRDGKLLCCLSGNPASSLTNFKAVALPAVRKLCGLAAPRLPEIPVTLTEPFRKKSPRTRLLRGKLDLSGGTTAMSITGEQGNSILHTMIGCDLLAMVPAGSGPLPEGTQLTAFLLP